MEQWLESAITMSAVETLRRLMALAPGTSHNGQQRPMERRIREWPAVRAERALGAMRSKGTGALTEEMTECVTKPIGSNM
jgi:hypothetical protein